MSSISRETEAIVLDSRDHGESDKIVTFFSLDQGKITGIAKGANRSKKRFLNKLELFSDLTINYSEKQRSTLAFISDAELNSSHINLRSSVEYYTAATLIREVLLIGMVERHSDKDIFNLLRWSLQSLDSGKSHLGTVSIFLLRFYERLGYCPDFSSCRICHLEFSTAENYQFHHAGGGLVCKKCLQGFTEGCSELSPGTIRIMRAVLSEPLNRLNRLHFSARALHQSLHMLHRYGRNLFQREIQSWKALRKNI